MNYPGETPVIQPDAGTVIADWESIVVLGSCSNVVFQGFEIRNTGAQAMTPANARKGGLGLRVYDSTYMSIYNNTIHDTARHGLLVQGQYMTIAGNHIYNASQLNSSMDDASGFDAALGIQDCSGSGQMHVWGNVVHDSYGECVDVLDATGVDVVGNRIYNCHSASLYTPNSASIILNRNWIYGLTDFYNRGGYRSPGIGLSNEGGLCGQTVDGVMISNNIIETTGYGVFYFDDPASTGIPPRHSDTYGHVTIEYNDFRSTVQNPIKFQTAKNKDQNGIDVVVLPNPGNEVDHNIAVNTSGFIWLELDQTTNWSEHGDYMTTGDSPGWVNPAGGSPANFKLRDDAWLRNQVTDDSSPPADDFFCMSRQGRSTHTVGAHEWGAQQAEYPNFP